LVTDKQYKWQHACDATLLLSVPKDGSLATQPGLTAVARRPTIHYHRLEILTRAAVVEAGHTFADGSLQDRVCTGAAAQQQQQVSD
jgi:hypothetical protein